MRVSGLASLLRHHAARGGSRRCGGFDAARHPGHEVLILRFVADLIQAEIGQRIGLSQIRVGLVGGRLRRLQDTPDAHDSQPMVA